MKKFIFMILILLFANPSFSQTGTTAEMFGLDQCLWVETEDQTIQNNYCAKMIVEDGTLTDNGNGSFTYSPAGAGYTVFDTSQELADILTDETGSASGGPFGLKAVFSVDPIITNSDVVGGPQILGKVNRNASVLGGIQIDDDDCTSEQGWWWWDSADRRFEFCNEDGGIPTAFQDFVNVVTSTDNAIARFDGTEGEIQNSGITIDDNNDLTGDGNLKVIGGSSANNTLSLQGNSAGGGNTATNKAISFLVGDSLTEAMTILQNGQIGMGSTSPTSPFNYRLLIENSSNGPVISSIRNTNAGTSAYAMQEISTSSISAAALFLYKFGSNFTTSGRNIANSALIEANSSAGLGIAASSSAGDIRFYTNANNERMKITSTGLVGIGTSSPESVLDLKSSSTALRVTRLSDPSANVTTPRNGMIAYDSTDNQLQGYIASAWKNIGGDLSGPTSSTDNAVTRFDGTTGKLVQDSSGVTIDDQDNMVIAGSLDVAGTLTVGVMTVDEPDSRFRVGIEDANKIGMVIQSPASPTAPAFEVQDSTGRPSVKFENNGFSTMRINKSGTMASASYDGFVLSVQNIGDAGEGSWIEILNSGGANRGAFFGMIGNQFQQFNWQGGDIEWWTGSGGAAPGANYPRLTLTSAGNLGLDGTAQYAWGHGWGGGVGILGIANAQTVPTTSLTTATALWSNSAELYTMGDSNTVKKIATTAVITLTDGATPALNAKLGSVFSLTAAGDRTIAVPSNPTAGQRIIIQHTASGGNRTLALNTGTGGFRFGTTITGLTITTSGLTDYIECIYNSGANKWDVINYQKGY